MRGAASSHRCAPISGEGTADAVLDDLSQELEAFESGLRVADHARLRAQLGDNAFDTARHLGRDLTPDEAHALALR